MSTMGEDREELIKNIKQTQNSQSDVSLTLAKHLLLNDDGKQKNLVFSPISIQIVKAKSTDDLNYLYKHVVNLVFVDASIADGPCLSLANGVWLDNSLSLKPCFKHVVDTLYKAACHQVDFKNKVSLSIFIYVFSI